MHKHFILSCLTLFTAFSSFGQGSITGTLHACRLDTAGVTVSGISSGGFWASSNTVVATVAVTTVGASHATVYAVWPGTATISYTLGGSTITTVTAVFTVDPSPASIEGLDTMCTGVSSIMTDAITGGIWTSDAPSVGTIDSVTGGIYGVSPGSVDFFYTLGNGCGAGALVIVDATDAGTISGASTVCAGSTTTLTETITGGTWSSSTTAIATIDPVSGQVIARAAGTAYLVYTVNGRCGVAGISDTVIVYSTATSVVLSGAPSVHVGSGISIAASTTGGTWSSSNTAIATVNSSGVVTGVSSGTVTITYSLTTCSGLITTTTNITVTALHTGITNTPAGDPFVTVFPNPTTDNLNLIWTETTTENADITLADITGKVVYRTTINMAAGAGIGQLSLPALTNGLYILTLKSAHINYNDKIQILH